MELNFIKPKNELEEGGRSNIQAVEKPLAEPEVNCPNCHKDIEVSKLNEQNLVCSCNYHFKMNARKHIDMIVDEDTFTELYEDMQSSDPLEFYGYQEKLEKARKASNEIEGVICGVAKIGGRDTCVFAMEPDFMMGSMGSVVGEKITLLFECALEYRLPVVGFTVSGGARMQEGLISLMQMAKTSAAIKRHSDAGLLYISVLTNPTTGGVTASFAMEADIILSEPGAMVGFAGKRVIEQTTKEVLPKEFQTAEFVLEHGFIDCIVSRKEQRKILGELLCMHSGGQDEFSL